MKSHLNVNFMPYAMHTVLENRQDIGFNLRSHLVVVKTQPLWVGKNLRGMKHA